MCKHRCLYVLIVAMLGFLNLSCPPPSNPSELLPGIAWTYGPTAGPVFCRYIEPTLDGGCAVSGANSGKPYALKLTPDGVYDWDNTLSNLDYNNSEQYDSACGIKETDDGDFFMLIRGHIHGDNIPENSFVLAKLDSNGNELGANSYCPMNPYNTGHYAGPSWPAALEFASNGNIVALGNTDVGSYNLTCYLETNPDGSVVSNLVVDSDNDNQWDEWIEDAEQTDDGGFILAAHGSSPGPDYSAYLIKLNADGTHDWTHEYQNTAEGQGAEAYGVTQTADGGYLVCGDLVNSIAKAIYHGSFVAKVDSSGAVVWFKHYSDAGKVVSANAIKETPDGGFLLGGYDNYGDALLSKYSATGTLIWRFPMSDFNGMVHDIILTDDGGCIVVCAGGTGGPTMIRKINHVYAD